MDSVLCEKRTRFHAALAAMHIAQTIISRLTIPPRKEYPRDSSRYKQGTPLRVPCCCWNSTTSRLQSLVPTYFPTAGRYVRYLATGVPEGVGVDVLTPVTGAVAVGVTVGVLVTVAVAIGVSPGRSVGVAVGVSVAVAVVVAGGVSPGRSVAVAVGVGVTVAVAVAVAVGNGAVISTVTDAVSLPSELVAATLPYTFLPRHTYG